MRNLFLITAAFWLVAGVVGAQERGISKASSAPGTPKRLALVIGNSDYTMCQDSCRSIGHPGEGSGHASDEDPVGA
jgi:hypothetical protein